uniref:Immunoglobulin domain-containing protein n=1 Tax=Sinocyclocheilus rhinocerous TaxID=307959 RepID=A0A673MXN7_9TELE
MQGPILEMNYYLFFRLFKQLNLGDSVTLHTGVTEIREDDDILWKFEAGKSHVAKIKKKKQNFSIYDGPDGRFRNRLKLDNQTGSLTITNITTQHAGVYQLEIAGAKKSSKTFSVSVYGEYSKHSQSFSINSICGIILIKDGQSDDFIS